MLSAPEPLAAHHALDRFDSGVATLDEWLKRRAAVNQTGGASRTYVVCDAGQVVGYYALASHAACSRGAHAYCYTAGKRDRRQRGGSDHAQRDE